MIIEQRKRIKREYIFASVGLIFTGALASLPLLLDVESKWQNWGTIVGGISQWVLVLCVLWIGRNYRKFQEMEVTARAELALNVQLSTRVVSSGDWRILEVRADIQNISRTNWFVPTAYVSVRPLIIRDGAGAFTAPGIETKKSGEIDFKQLPERSELGVRNLAAFENTMVKLSPDEAEILLGWYVLDEGLVAEVPVVVVNLEVFGVSCDYLKKKERRNDFLRLMADGKGVRNSYIMFGRWSILDEDKKRAGKYYMISPPADDLDSVRVKDNGIRRDERTEEYEEFLESMAGWSRQAVVNLLGEEASERGIGFVQQR